MFAARSGNLCTVFLVHGACPACEAWSAVQDGRVIILTSNHPERIPRVLMRPGRVDRHISFDCLSSTQAHALFSQFYSHLHQSPELTRLATEFAHVSGEIQGHSRAQVVRLDAGHQSVDSPHSLLEADQVQSGLGRDFDGAAAVKQAHNTCRQCRVSPALLQGIMMQHKSHPDQAVQELQRVAAQLDLGSGQGPSRLPTVVHTDSF